jgi:hypothetical protein
MSGRSHFPALLAAAIVAGCFRPSPVDCLIRCGPNESCADGMVCSVGLCTRGAYCGTRPPESCGEEALRCGRGGVERCGGDRLWSEPLVCPLETPACHDGRCVQCVPGASRCASEGDRVQPCDPAGVWGPPADCGPERVCRLGSCEFPRTVRQVVAGAEHSCVLFGSGELKCWGANDSGQLGLGDTDDRGGEPHDLGAALAAVPLGTNDAVTALAAGGRHTCALLRSGRVRCWGANDRGQLGLGHRIDQGTRP